MIYLLLQISLIHSIIKILNKNFGLVESVSFDIFFCVHIMSKQPAGGKENEMSQIDLDFSLKTLFSDFSLNDLDLLVVRKD